jgi:hypothetical protein
MITGSARNLTKNNPETRRNGDHGRSCQPDRRKSYFAVAGETLMCCSG